MDPGIATITAAIIAAGTSIAVALIVNRSNPKRSVHEVWFRYPHKPPEDSRFVQILRGIGTAIVVLIFFAGQILVVTSVFVWASPPSYEPQQGLIIALCLVSAALLFCIARWVYNLAKAPPADEDQD